MNRQDRSTDFLQGVVDCGGVGRVENERKLARLFLGVEPFGSPARPKFGGAFPTSEKGVGASRPNLNCQQLGISLPSLLLPHFFPHFCRSSKVLYCGLAVRVTCLLSVLFVTSTCGLCLDSGKGARENSQLAVSSQRQCRAKLSRKTCSTTRVYRHSFSAFELRTQATATMETPTAMSGLSLDPRRPKIQTKTMVLLSLMSQARQ